MKIYLTYNKKGKVFQLEHKIEKLHRKGNDFIVYLKSKNGITSYPAFWLSDCGTEIWLFDCGTKKMHVMFYKFSKRKKKIVERSW